MNENSGKRHSLILQNCRSLSISGVTDADSFDEKKIRVFTECGELCIYGEDLHVNEMSVESGSLTIEGSITALIYGDKNATKRLRLLGKLFK